MKYPPYITLEKRLERERDFPGCLEYLSFQFSPDTTSALWGGLLVYDIDDFSVYTMAEYS